MKYLAERGLIAVDVDKRTGKKVYSVSKWFVNRNARFVEFRIGQIAEQKDPIDDADEMEDTGHYPPTAKEYEYQQEEFRELGADEYGDLPF